MSAIMSVHVQKQNYISLDMTLPPSLPENVQVGRTKSTKGSRLVRTEFVFPAAANHSTVHVCGDWSEWHPIPMSIEKGKNANKSLRTCFHFLRFNTRVSASRREILCSVALLTNFDEQ